MEMGNRAVWVQPGPGALRIYTGGPGQGGTWEIDCKNSPPTPEFTSSAM